MSTLKSIQLEIESLQSKYREICGRNSGVIRGAEDSAETGDRVIALMSEYNSRSKRTMYSGGKIVARGEVA